MDPRRKYKIVRKLYFTLFPTVAKYLSPLLNDCSEVLDLGCGWGSPLEFCHVSYSIGVEVFEPYLKESSERKIHNDYVKADVRKLNFKPKSFDAVVMLELLEHLSKEEGHELLQKAEIWARKRIIVSTPSGYSQQGAIDSNPSLAHQSGWTYDELKGLGFDISGLSGWKRLRESDGDMRFRPKLFWFAILALTQYITRYFPKKYAFGLFCVKRIK